MCCMISSVLVLLIWLFMHFLSNSTSSLAIQQLISHALFIYLVFLQTILNFLIPKF